MLHADSLDGSSGDSVRDHKVSIEWEMRAVLFNGP